MAANREALENCARMTSTSFNVGLDDTPRLSSRVLRPPGGGHTDIFGGEPEPQQIHRRGPPASTIGSVVGPDEPKPANGTEAPSQNGQKTPQEATPAPAAGSDPAPVSSVTSEPAKAEPPKRVRVPPGGFSSGLCTGSVFTRASRCGMEGGGRQSRLLSRLLGRLRGDHHKYNLDKRYSFTSTVNKQQQPGDTPSPKPGAKSIFYLNIRPTTNEALHVSSMSESTGCSTADDEDLDPQLCCRTSPNASSAIDDDQFAANIDLRYGGQYLTPEQLPEFCDQLHHLVEVIRNIQSYAKVTGEYPSELERRLEQEAREVSALAAEARNARDVAARARSQRRAVRALRKHLVSHLASLRDSEIRELENTVRLSDRKLFKSWEALKDSSDPAAFDPLLDEIKNKQAALECLVRLVDSKQSALSRTAPPPTPLPPPDPHDNDDSGATGALGGSGGRSKRHEARRSSGKRRRREPRSVPLSGEPSRHAPPPQVTLYIQGTESTSRYRVGSTGAVALTPLDLPSGGSVRDILFFTTN